MAGLGWVSGAAALVALVWLDRGRLRLGRARREAEAAGRQLQTLLQWRARAATRWVAAGSAPPALAAAVAARAAAPAGPPHEAAERDLSRALAAAPHPQDASGADLADVCARLDAHWAVVQARLHALEAARSGARGRFLARTFAPRPVPLPALGLDPPALTPAPTAPESP